MLCKVGDEMKIVNVKDVVIGEGDPKLCVSIMGNTKEEIKKEVSFLSNKEVDLIEWRLDFFTYNNEWKEIEDILALIHTFAKELPLLCTFRTQAQGGQMDIGEKHYEDLLYKMMESPYIDIIDIEYCEHRSQIYELILHAQRHHKKVLLSYHNFHQTFSYETCISLWKKMQSTGADILKIALMPKEYADVNALMKSSFFMYTQCLKQPMIAISMSSLGKISRLCAPFIGSSIIFVTFETANSLGQPNIYEMRWMLKSLKNLVSK